MTSIYSCTWQVLKKILVVKFSLKVKVIPQSNTPFSFLLPSAGKETDKKKCFLSEYQKQ